MTQTNSPRFYCDAMLGRLARELRLLGLDTAYDRLKGGLTAYRAARAEDRIFLTRNSRTRTLPGSFFVESQNPVEQLEQVRARFGITAAVRRRPLRRTTRPARGGNRCIECNEPLRRISRDQARPAIPFYIFQIHHEFHCCPKCGRVYWPGSHLKNIEARLANPPARTRRQSDNERR
ncbi:MAG: Mut7-C RNAse domain-containing protein [candidate division WOR-3 bacterium]